MFIELTFNGNPQLLLGAEHCAPKGAGDHLTRRIYKHPAPGGA